MLSLTRTWILVVLIVPLLLSIAAYLLPYALRERDDRYYLPPTRTAQELHELGACAGKTRVQLSNPTLERLGLLEADITSTTGGTSKLPTGNVELSYITTRCNQKNQNEDTTSNEETLHQNKEHVLLIHGTGISSMVFTKNVGDDNNDDDAPILWDLFRNKGYDVTAVDFRGHGLSEITTGPYTIELIAADLASFVRDVFPGTKFHCYGLSIGFGSCMAMAVYDADLVQTVSGNGFLFDRTNYDMAAYVFSREPIVRMLGMSLIAQIGQIVMKISQPNLLPKWMRHTHMDGYVHTASGWLEFDLTWALPDNMTVPTLYLLPEYDQDIGHTRVLVDREIQMMPAGVGEVIEFPGHSHCMLGEKGGAQKMAEAVLAFFERCDAGS